MRRFERLDGSVTRFWEVALVGLEVIQRSGRVGTRGSARGRVLSSVATAQAMVASLIAEKVRDGYREVKVAGHGTAAAALLEGTPPAPGATKGAGDAEHGETSATADAGDAERGERGATKGAGDAEGERMSATKGAARAEQGGASLVAPRATASPRPDCMLPTVELPRIAPLLASDRVPVAPPPHPRAALAEVRAAVSAYRFTSLTTRAGPWREAAVRALTTYTRDTPPDQLDLDEAAFVCAALGRLDAPKTSDALTPVDALVELWAAVAGPRFAFEAYARAGRVRFGEVSLLFEIAENGRPWPPGGEWRALRRVVARLPEAARAALEADARRLLVGSVPTTRAVLAAAFERTDWASADRAAVVAAGCGGALVALAASASTVGEAQAWLDAVAKDDRYAPFVVKHHRHDFLARFGVDAVPLFFHVFGRATVADDDALTSALACVRTPDVAAFFVEQLARGPHRLVAKDYLAANPDLAALPLLVASTGARALDARALVRSLAASAPETLASAAKSAPPAARALAEELLATPPEDAPDAAVPESLRSPPWLRPGGAPRRVVRTTPHARPATVHWLDGEREALLREIRAPWSEHEVASVRAHLHAHLRGSTAPLLAKAYPFAFLLLPEDEVRPFLATADPDAYVWGDLGLERQILARLGADAVPLLLGALEATPAALFGALRRVDAHALAPIAAALLRDRRAADDARLWLTTFPEAAATGLVPPAVGPKGKPRERAEAALRLLGKTAHRDVVLRVAASYGSDAEAAVHALVEGRLDVELPKRLAPLPAFVEGAMRARPILRGGGRLPEAATRTLLVMLSVSGLDEPYPALAEACEGLDRRSTAAFAWALFEAWLGAGAPNDARWAMEALGHLGDDETARKLGQHLRAWPGEAAHARAVHGLGVLSRLGTDGALAVLDGIAQKVKFRGLRERAGEEMARVAARRGLTADGLADRLVPRLDLDREGGVVLDFGPRSFVVGVDAFGLPVVRDDAGRPLRDLPKASGDDDVEKAALATARFRQLKKDARAIVTAEARRLERAMCFERRWKQEGWRAHVVAHPLVGSLARRLVWGAYGDDERPTVTFRLAEDGTLAGPDDRALRLPEQLAVGLVHPVHVDPGAIAAWQKVVGDYELVQPFVQLGREVHRRPEGERAEATLDTVRGVTVPPARVVGLTGRGWRRGPPQDAGIVEWMEKPLAEDLVVTLDLEPGILVGDLAGSDEQELGAVNVPRDGTRLRAVAWSELLADLAWLRG